MLKPSRSHQDYIAFVHRATAKVAEPNRHLPAKAKLLLLDLPPAVPILALLYAADGRPAIPEDTIKGRARDIPLERVRLSFLRRQLVSPI